MIEKKVNDQEISNLIEKRCGYDNYGPEQAAQDTLLYQCPNQQWKEQIMESKLTFQEAVDYGMTKLTAKAEGKTISGIPMREGRRSQRLAK